MGSLWSSCVAHHCGSNAVVATAHACLRPALGRHVEYEAWRIVVARVASAGANSFPGEDAPCGRRKETSGCMFALGQRVRSADMRTRRHVRT